MHLVAFLDILSNTFENAKKKLCNFLAAEIFFLFYMLVYAGAKLYCLVTGPGHIGE